MIDPVTLSIAIGGILISILTYLRHSSCCGGFIEIDTRSVPSTPKLQSPKTPLLTAENKIN